MSWEETVVDLEAKETKPLELHLFNMVDIFLYFIALLFSIISTMKR